ncbi:hypothetical protein [Paractinoplanes durhamensis]|uniref:hypothetical protein n=1 Tax=Paractinoplanes durhamensis TaxID=113563 RepID=UPI0036371B23
MTVDCHQHLWPPRFLDALRRRSEFPFMRGWTLFLPGEPPYEVDPAAHDLAVRKRDDADLVLLSLSSPLGIEHLPGPEGAELIDVWHESALELGAKFQVWAAASVAGLDPDGLAKVLREERIAGLQLPATALTEPAAIARLRPCSTRPSAPANPYSSIPAPLRPATRDFLDGGPQWSRTFRSFINPGWPGMSPAGGSIRGCGSPSSRSPASPRCTTNGSAPAAAPSARWIRMSSTRPRPTAPGRSTRWSGWSASIRWCTAPTGRMRCPPTRSSVRPSRTPCSPPTPGAC